MSNPFETYLAKIQPDLRGGIATEQVISHVMPLERLEEAFTLLRDDSANTLKVIIRP